MADIASMRPSMKDYNVENEMVRERLNTAVAQTLVLRATVEIMEKRLASCKETPRA
jgi:hypothetical protein